ncbi:MAG TPA: hypothetical protein VM871_09310 [Flavisolibacter sp.]|nr:hypothetical protein [Flavisolibacter sp.]
MAAIIAKGFYLTLHFYTMATVFVNVTDETAGGKVVRAARLEFAESLVTVAGIIERRVSEEVARHNRERGENFFGLVQPLEVERKLNQPRSSAFRFVDAEKQITAAKEAFNRNGFFLLIDNLQAESLEQTFLLHPESTVSFVKLTPLVGG